jgi:hypothetical protein
MNNQNNKLYGTKSISQVFNSTMGSITNEIENLDKDFLLKLNSHEYLDSMVRKHILSLPVFDFEKAYSKSYEKDIPATYLPDSYKVHDYKSQKTAFIQYFIPVIDKDKLLCYQPSLHTPDGGMNFIIISDAITKAYLNPKNEPKRIRNTFNTEVSTIRINFKALIREIEAFNDTLEEQCKVILQSRRNKILNL